MVNIKLKQKDLKKIKNDINLKHIEFYDKTFDILSHMLNKYSNELFNSEFEYIDIPKNAISILEFLISAIGKVQKGQRLALGLDNDVIENVEPEINILDGLTKSKI